MKGVRVARSLTEKGTNAHVLEKICNLSTVFSVEGDGSPDTRHDANVQKADRGQGSESGKISATRRG